jgi:hypothetical protein
LRTRLKKLSASRSKRSAARAAERRASATSGGTSNSRVRSGWKAALHPGFQCGDAFDGDAAPAALVGIAGIGEAVGHHPHAARQRRQDQSGQMFLARGEHQQQFGVGIHVAVQQQFAQGFAERGAAGFPGDDDLPALPAQPVGDEFQMGAFAGAVDAFEGDEFTGSHRW